MTYLNRIQQLCTNLDAEPEFVMGHVYGMRQWSLREAQDGPHLYGHNDFEWSLNQTNQAKCTLPYWTFHKDLAVSEHVVYSSYHFDQALERSIWQLFQENPNSQLAYIDLDGSDTTMSIPRHAIGGRFPVNFPWRFSSGYHGLYINGKPNPHSYQGVLRFRLKVTSPVAQHDVTDPRCTCGFYAYTDLNSLHENSRRQAGSYFGIVKAWGKVTQGTKGFRAEKAQIVGLTPAMSKMTVLKYDQTVNMQKTQVTEEGFVVAYEDVPVPSFQWVPSNTSPLESQLIPVDFPRYTSLEEMFTAYQKLTEHDGR